MHPLDVKAYNRCPLFGPETEDYRCYNDALRGARGASQNDAYLMEQLPPIYWLEADNGTGYQEAVGSASFVQPDHIPSGCTLVTLKQGRVTTNLHGDWCIYCGTFQGPNGELRMGHDCCYCGSN